MSDPNTVAPLSDGDARSASATAPLRRAGDKMSDYFVLPLRLADGFDIFDASNSSTADHELSEAKALAVLRAINCHDELVAALTALSDVVFGTGLGSEPDVYADYDALTALQRKVSAALAKASGAP